MSAIELHRSLPQVFRPDREDNIRFRRRLIRRIRAAGATLEQPEHWPPRYLGPDNWLRLLNQITIARLDVGDNVAIDASDTVTIQ